MVQILDTALIGGNVCGFAKGKDYNYKTLNLVQKMIRNTNVDDSTNALPFAKPLLAVRFSTIFLLSIEKIHSLSRLRHLHFFLCRSPHYYPFLDFVKMSVQHY